MNRNLFLMGLLAVTILLTVSACTAAGPGGGGSAADFYKNNTVTLIVNGGVGGTTDYAGRCFATYWTEVTGGPAMPVKVMSGGGGIEGLNYVYGAKADGLTLGITTHSSDITGPKLLGVPGPNWDPTTLLWVGSYGHQPSGFVVRPDATWKTAEDLQKVSTLKIGTTNPSGTAAVTAVIAIELLGIKDPKVTFGYETVDMGLAAKRGEIDAYGASVGVILDDVTRQLCKPICMLTSQRSEWFKDTPAITELVKLTPAQQEMLAFQSALSGAKSMFFPPGTPADRVEYMRGAFNKIMAYEPFVKLYKVRFPVLDKTQTGQETDVETKNVLAMDPTKVEGVRNLFKKYMKT